MVKEICKKALIIILIIIFSLMICNNNRCLALADVTSSDIWDDWEPSVQDDSELQEKVGVILDHVQIIGIIISVVTLMTIGIKFMLGSVEEKAHYKQVMAPWAVGAILVFAITFVPSLVYENVSKTISTPVHQGVNENKWNRHIDGYKDAFGYAAKQAKNGDFFQGKTFLGNKYLSNLRNEKDYGMANRGIDTSTPYGSGYLNALVVIIGVGYDLDDDPREYIEYGQQKLTEAVGNDTEAIKQKLRKEQLEIMANLGSGKDFTLNNAKAGLLGTIIKQLGGDEFYQ